MMKYVQIFGAKMDILDLLLQFVNRIVLGLSNDNLFQTVLKKTRGWSKLSEEVNFQLWCRCSRLTLISLFHGFDNSLKKRNQRDGCTLCVHQYIHPAPKTNLMLVMRMLFCRLLHASVIFSSLINKLAHWRPLVLLVFAQTSIVKCIFNIVT